MGKYITASRIWQRIWFLISKLPMSGHGLRPRILKLAGIQILDPKHTFISTNISWDTVYPEGIIIESGVRITGDNIILTHYINPSTGEYSNGIVRIKKGAFIGAGSIITKPITIGENSIVGAGSVVTKNIPANEVWAGNPARFIKRR